MSIIKDIFHFLNSVYIIHKITPFLYQKSNGNHCSFKCCLLNLVFFGRHPCYKCIIWNVFSDHCSRSTITLLPMVTFPPIHTSSPIRIGLAFARCCRLAFGVSGCPTVIGSNHDMIADKDFSCVKYCKIIATEKMIANEYVFPIITIE